MREVDMNEEDIGERVRWRQRIQCGAPLKIAAKRQKRAAVTLFEDINLLSICVHLSLCSRVRL